MDVLVNNKVKVINLIDPKSGCSSIQDLIGNADGFDGFSDEENMYIMSSDNYEWWSSYMEIEQDILGRAKYVHDQLDNDDQEKFDQELVDIDDSDIDIQQDCQVVILEKWEISLKDD